MVRLSVLELENSAAVSVDDVPMLPSCRRAKLSIFLGFVELDGRGGGLDGLGRLAPLLSCDERDAMRLWFCDPCEGLNPSETPIASGPYKSHSSLSSCVEYRAEFLVDVRRSSPLECRSGAAMFATANSQPPVVVSMLGVSLRSGSSWSRPDHQFLVFIVQFEKA